MTKLHTYDVSGFGAFPYDMLRYDQAWPASGEDTAKMEDAAFFAADFSVIQKQITIRLASHTKPTIERWRSFNWGVQKIV